MGKAKKIGIVLTYRALFAYSVIRFCFEVLFNSGEFYYQQFSFPNSRNENCIEESMDSNPI